jgi:hypothetical protein
MEIKFFSTCQLHIYSARSTMAYCGYVSCGITGSVHGCAASIFLQYRTQYVRRSIRLLFVINFTQNSAEIDTWSRLVLSNKMMVQ